MEGSRLGCGHLRSKPVSSWVSGALTARGGNDASRARRRPRAPGGETDPEESRSSRGEIGTERKDSLTRRHDAENDSDDDDDGDGNKDNLEGTWTETVSSDPDTDNPNDGSEEDYDTSEEYEDESGEQSEGYDADEDSRGAHADGRDRFSSSSSPREQGHERHEGSGWSESAVKPHGGEHQGRDTAYGDAGAGTRTRVDLTPAANNDTEDSIRVSVVTWNLAEVSPTAEDVGFLGRIAKGSDLVAVGVQEIENLKPRRHEGRRSREWRRLLLR